MNDTIVSNHATTPAVPANATLLRSVLALLLGTVAACLVTALGAGAIVAIGSPDIPGEPALDIFLMPMYALLSLMFIVPVVVVFGVPYAGLLLALGRFRFWPMTLGGFAIAGGPALISAAAMHFGVSNGLLDVLTLLGTGAAILASEVPYPVAGLLLGALGALGAAAFHRTHVWIARSR